MKNKTLSLFSSGYEFMGKVRQDPNPEKISETIKAGEQVLNIIPPGYDASIIAATVGHLKKAEYDKISPCLVMLELHIYLHIITDKTPLYRMALALADISTWTGVPERRSLAGDNQA